jgi:diguanylate cyclase (GGDEF)-like protein
MTPLASKKIISVFPNLSSLPVMPEPKPNEAVILDKGLRSLYHATAELQFSKPLPALLKSILRGLKSGTDISKAAVFIKEGSSCNLKGISSIGLSEKKILETNVFLTLEEEAEFLKSNLLPLNKIELKSSQERLVQFFENEINIKSPGIIALEIRDHLIGVLVYEKPASLLHEGILTIFSRQAALTIENAKLFAKVEEMALKDTLTGLYNRRYFQQILDYELNRAKRYHQPISLIFLDVDHFKKINDTYGHSVGDQFLKQIANKFSSLFRTTDLAARYAGDEFVAILPATDREGSNILAKRILEVLSQHQILVRGTKLQVSVSIGVATYENFENIGSMGLVARADKAMYEAKAQGRNRVKRFEDMPKTTV